MTKTDRLSPYRERRDFSLTSEPPGNAGRKHKGPLTFIVQKHAARRLHYDFRLEWQGVLLSWAVTKGPSLDPKDKRLAVQTEDHPVAYGGFEGKIPKGQYGGGTVMLWDQGVWEPTSDPQRGLAEGKLTFTLKGARMQGGWALVRMRDKNNKKQQKRQNWLLIKERDDYADDKRELTVDYATSVKTKRRLEDIEAEGATYLGVKNGQLQTEDGRLAKTPNQKTHARKVSKPRGAKPRESGAPAFQPPQLATLTNEVPKGQQWLFENKFDGYRCLAAVGSGGVAMYTRSGLDWREKFTGLAAQLEKLKCKNALLDGEVVAQRKGRSDFSALQHALKHGGPLTYYVFDILHLDGQTLGAEPLVERKEVLANLFARSGDIADIQMTHYIEGDGEAALQHVCDAGGEGIICKRRNAKYSNKRDKSWLKVKCTRRQEFVIAGYSPSAKKARPFASILVGQYVDGNLIYKGRIGTGFDDSELRSLAAKFAKIKINKNPFSERTGSVERSIARDAQWLQPRLVAEVDFAELTAAGHIRHGVFLGLREDKDAAQIAPERATPLDEVKDAAPSGEKSTGAEKRRGGVKRANANTRTKASEKMTATTRNSKANSGDFKSEKLTKIVPEDAVVKGIAISHPEREIFPSAGLSKLEIAAYIGALGERLAAIAGHRPVSLVRCPQGLGKKCFFQRHAGKGFPDSFKTVGVEEKSGSTADYMYFDGPEGFVSAIQMGAIEFHMWGARNDRLDRPDRLVFDLDPDAELDFATVRDAAFEMRDLLNKMSLRSVPLVTGGKGVHLCVPIKRTLDWDTAKLFTKTFAHLLSDKHPDRFIATMSKAKRKGKIFIDWLRNERGATAIAPYSVRAREGAPVAVPVTWRELKTLESANTFTTVAALARLTKPCPYLKAMDTPSAVTKSILRHMEDF